MDRRSFLKGVGGLMCAVALPAAVVAEAQAEAPQSVVLEMDDESRAALVQFANSLTAICEPVQAVIDSMGKLAEYGPVAIIPGLSFDYAVSRDGGKTWEDWQHATLKMGAAE